jgi:hypothetical protein
MSPIKKLSPNCYVITQGETILLQSYNTIVLKKVNEEIYLLEGQPESKTTAKHINIFLLYYTSYEGTQDKNFITNVITTENL